jgi:hypothetical protein
MWKIVSVAQKRERTLQEFLSSGWEPFSVVMVHDEPIIYLKKLATMEERMEASRKVLEGVP